MTTKELTISSHVSGNYQIATGEAVEFHPTPCGVADAAATLLVPELDRAPLWRHLQAEILQTLIDGAGLVDIELDDFGTDGFCVHGLNAGCPTTARFVTAAGSRGLYEGR